MKGIIFEIKNKKAVALDSGGRFVNLKNKGYTVGEEIELGRANQNVPYRKFAAIAVALIIVIVLAAGGIFGGIYYDANLKTAYTVQMDINPSVTLSLNSKDIVIKAEGNNSDGAALHPNDLAGETLDGFITKYIERFVESDMYISETAYTVKIVVDGKIKATADTKTISAKVESVVRENFEEKGIPVTTETENGVKEAEPRQPQPTEFTYSYYNKLLSDTAILSGKVTEVATLSKPVDCPAPGDSGYPFAFWWDGSTKDALGAPVDFFANGDRAITADTELFAVWSFKDGYTADGTNWIIAPTTWTYSYYNKLLSDTAIRSGEVYDGDMISKMGDSPSPGDSGYTFAFWWDGSTKDALGAPVDFFANGDRAITADTGLFAVWLFKDGCAVDRTAWIIEPTTWIYSYYNKLFCETAISYGEAFDGDKISKPKEDPDAGESGYTFELWWDGKTQDDSGAPANFFANGDRTITADIELFAVWKTDAGAYTSDGQSWLNKLPRRKHRGISRLPYSKKLNCPAYNFV